MLGISIVLVSVSFGKITLDKPLTVKGWELQFSQADGHFASFLVIVWHEQTVAASSVLEQRPAADYVERRQRNYVRVDGGYQQVSSYFSDVLRFANSTRQPGPTINGDYNHRRSAQVLHALSRGLSFSILKKRTGYLRLFMPKRLLTFIRNDLIFGNYFFKIN